MLIDNLIIFVRDSPDAIGTVDTNKIKKQNELKNSKYLPNVFTTREIRNLPIDLTSQTMISYFCVIVT